MEKVKSCLVTTSLVGAVKWSMTAPNIVIKDDRGGDGHLTWREKAIKDLENTLNRVKGTFPKEAEQGMVFEKMVYNNANKDKLTGTEKFQRVCKEVKGYEFYKKGGIEETIQGEKCYLYAKYDAIVKLPEVKLKDIKTTGSYSPGKYLNGFQHKLYCLISGANEFDYVIAEWLQYPVIKDIYIERFIVEDREKMKNEVITEIEECFNVIKDLELWETYRTKFCLY